jgi:cysteinyl-tRNA synthetase
VKSKRNYKHRGKSPKVESLLVREQRLLFLSCTGLKVNNSLKLGSLEEFVPNEGKLVRWYTCGPTVYDQAHFGHARNYVTFDIIQRIFREYFHYDIFYVMNITDIDDKIILRSRRNYLFAKYVTANPKISSQVLDDLKASWAEFIAGLEKKLATNKVN